MSIQEKIDEIAEEITIDLSHIPLRPTSKKEIQQLEMALIIATLYSPEVIELIKDPIERATWVDSLAVSAAALARYKAGYSIRQIADEVGRSETMIRAHLNGKTKAGKLVLQTYEKLKRGELKIVVPFLRVPKTMVEADLQVMREEKKKIEEELKRTKEELENLKKQWEDLKNKYDQLIHEKQELEERLDTFTEALKKIKEIIENVTL